MRALIIAPTLDAAGERLVGRTSRTARLLWLYSYDRCVTLDRQRRVVTIATKRLWLWTSQRRVAFDAVNRIVLRAQPLSGLGVLSVLTLGIAPALEGALFFISLGLHDSHDELFLFTIWEDQGADSGWTDAIAGERAAEPSLGDEGAGDVITKLREFLAVPVSAH